MNELVWCPETRSMESVTLRFLRHSSVSALLNVFEGEECCNVSCGKRGKGECRIGKVIEGKWK